MSVTVISLICIGDDHCGATGKRRVVHGVRDVRMTDVIWLRAARALLLGVPNPHVLHVDAFPLPSRRSSNVSGSAGPGILAGIANGMVLGYLMSRSMPVTHSVCERPGRHSIPSVRW
jgi:hypothetical protein